MDQLTQNIAWCVFIATIGERIAELFVSKRNAEWSFQKGGVEYGAEHYKAMVVMHSLFLMSIPLEFFWNGSGLSLSIRMGAAAIAIVCQICRWWIIITLGKQWNTRVIIVPGLTRILSGPYRFLNHPNYVVVAVETMVLPLIFGSWRTSMIFSLLNAWMMAVRLRVENVALSKLKSV